jgi:hypothetical protein
MKQWEGQEEMSGSPHGIRPFWRISTEHEGILKRINRKYINCDDVNWTAATQGRPPVASLMTM